MLEILKTDFDFIDNRGRLTQLVHGGFQQINVLTSNANTVRGGHYHKVSTEAFYVVSGEVLVKVKDGKTSKEYTFREGDFFRITPYTVHSMEFDQKCVMVQMYSVPVEAEDGTKDIFPE